MPSRRHVRPGTSAARTSATGPLQSGCGSTASCRNPQRGRRSTTRLDLGGGGRRRPASRLSPQRTPRPAWVAEATDELVTYPPDPQRTPAAAVESRRDHLQSRPAKSDPETTSPRSGEDTTQLLGLPRGAGSVAAWRAAPRDRTAHVNLGDAGPAAGAEG